MTLFKSFLQKREQDKRQKEFAKLSDSEFIEKIRKQSYGIKSDDVIGRLGLVGAQNLLRAEWESAKSLMELPAWRQLLKRLATTFAQRDDSHDFLREFYAVEPDAPTGRAIRLAALRLATVPRYDTERTLILVADDGEPAIMYGYPLRVKFVSRAAYTKVEADYRAQERLTDWWQADLCPAAQAIQYNEAQDQATLRFLWDGLGNGERYELRQLAPSLWGAVDYGEVFVELSNA
jgi:hypothetical protein